MNISDENKVVVIKFMGHHRFDEYNSEMQDTLLSEVFDWNKLMSVFEKISKLPSLGDVEFPKTGSLGIYSNIKFNMPNIKNTWIAIAECIKWYNNKSNASQN